MTDKSNKLDQFWHELKRRKVFRVIAMYAATAFILLELVDIVAPSLGLPDWTLNLVIVLLSVGFPISVILAWIFDLTPEGVIKTESIDVLKGQEPTLISTKRRFRASDVIIVVLIIVVGILVYPKMFKKDKFEAVRDADGRISIAVMPFENQTGDTTLNWFQRGMSSLIVNGLGSSTELAVRDEQSMYELLESNDQVLTAGLSPSRSKEAAEKIHAETFVSGSFQGREGNYLIMANLVNTKSGDIIWTHKVEGDLKSSDYRDLANSLCNEIKNYLEIMALEQDADYDFREAYTNSAEAYRYYIEGMNMIMSGDYVSALESLDKALEIDSTFIFATFYKAFVYTFKVPQEWENMKLWTRKAYNIRENLPQQYQNWIGLWYSGFFTKDLQEILRYCRIIEEGNPESRLIWFDLGVTYMGFARDYEKAERAFQEIEEISNGMGNYWKYKNYYQRYGEVLIEMGKYGKAKEMFELGLSFSTDNFWKREMYYQLSIATLLMGEMDEANDYLEKYVSVKKEMGQSQDNIDLNMGGIYYRANLMTEAEKYTRRAYKLNPKWEGNFSLGRILIDGNINIEEGLDCINRALEINPANPFTLYWKANAFYKLGRYEECLVLLEKAIDINELFFPDANSLVSEVKQALAKQKSEQ